MSVTEIAQVALAVIALLSGALALVTWYVKRSEARLDKITDAFIQALKDQSNTSESLALLTRTFEHNSKALQRAFEENTKAMQAELRAISTMLRDKRGAQK